MRLPYLDEAGRARFAALERRKLSELFGWAQEVLYCSDDAHSQQNRCLVSGRRRPVVGNSGEPSVTGHAAFLELLDERFGLLRGVLPIDLRVRGLVSSRYEHDGTVL